MWLSYATRKEQTIKLHTFLMEYLRYTLKFPPSRIKRITIFALRLDDFKLRKHFINNVFKSNEG